MHNLPYTCVFNQPHFQPQYHPIIIILSHCDICYFTPILHKNLFTLDCSPTGYILYNTWVPGTMCRLPTTNFLPCFFSLTNLHGHMITKNKMYWLMSPKHIFTFTILLRGKTVLQSTFFYHAVLVGWTSAQGFSGRRMKLASTLLAVIEAS